MKYRELRPLKDKPEYWEAIELEVRDLFRQQIYLKLARAIGFEDDLILNAQDPLNRAISRGKIQYVRGHFEGKFDAETSKALKKMGATWNNEKGWWALPERKLTADVRSSIGTSYSRFQQMSQKVDKQLQEIVPAEVAEKLSIERVIDSAIYKVNKDFESSVKQVTVAPKLTPRQMERISKQYNDNLSLHIKDWTREEVKKLRAEVSINAMEGYRYEGMVKIIQDSYGVSQNKARFLARQETNLMMSTFRETRYKDIGVTQYKWRCMAGSAAHPVRPFHKRLDGTVHTWSDPPIVDKYGNRKHPGQDYNCRCIAIPLVGTT